MQTLESALAGGLPENFRSPEEGMYFLNRYLEINPRMQRYEKIAKRTGAQELVLKRLKDLIFNNCAGRNFALPDNAGDFLGAIDSEKNPELKNCIVLVQVEDHTPSGDESKPKFKLSIPGGFNAIGESMEHTIAREGFEETGAQNASNFVIIGEQSTRNRDDHYNVISTSAACVVDKAELAPNDDAKGIIIVQLIDENGELNMDYFKAGTYTDATGKVFTHNGLRADHDMVIMQAFNWWKLNGERRGLTFDQALKLMSINEQQEAYKNFVPNPPGADRFERIQIDNAGTITLTPNVQFALDHTTQILEQAMIENPDKIAKKFIYDLIENNLLPPFPQRDTTVHCLIVEDDNLVVFERDDGTLALPGKYYSPEINNSKSKRGEGAYPQREKFGYNLVEFAHQVADDEFGIDFRPTSFIGTASLGDLPDGPYPSLSYVYAGVHTGTHSPTVGDLPPGSKIIKIPIWKDKKTRELSDKVINGIDGKGWAFNHGNKIIQKYFRDFVIQNDSGGRMTAEKMLRHRQLLI